MNFQLSPHVDENKVFLLQRSALVERLDCEYYQPSHYHDLKRLRNSPFRNDVLDHVCFRIVDGPFGSSIKSQDYVENGIPFIRVADVTRGEGSIRTDDLIYITEEAHQKILRSRVVPGDVVIAKTGATMGAASLVPASIPEANIRGDLAALSLNPSDCLPKYIVTYINTNIGQRLFWRLDSGGTRGRVVIGNLKKYPIVIPPIEIQEEIIARMDDAFAAKKQKEEEAQRSLDSIDDYLLSELGIDLPEPKEDKIQSRVFYRKLSEVSGGRLDAGFYKPKYISLMSSIRALTYSRLGHIVSFSNETWDQESIFSDIFPYIEIGEIDISLGEIRTISEVRIEDAPSRARMIVRGGDILISTTRPNRGAIVEMERGEKIFIASTGFAIIRKIVRKDIIQEFLFYILRQSISLKQMEQRSSGGNYPAITQEELQNLLIPIPPIEQQLEIVDRITAIRTQAKQLRQAAAAELEQAKQEVEAMILGERGNKA